MEEVSVYPANNTESRVNVKARVSQHRPSKHRTALRDRGPGSGWAKVSEQGSEVKVSGFFHTTTDVLTPFLRVLLLHQCPNFHGRDLLSL